MDPFSTPPQDRDAVIRDRQNAVIARMQADPEAARSTIVTTAVVGEGLACNVRQGRFSALLDLGPGMGGDAAGPSPGFFGRAAIGGCVAMAVKMLAAREGVRFRRVTATVETDFDDTALFGLGASSAAPTETRVIVTVVTDADPAVVDDIVARTLDMDPWFLALRDPQRVRTTVRTTESEAVMVPGQ
ncbi:MAG: OsmC family protein [Rhodobacterales bacterium]|nr:OsmC family protein [Rhodobacterales bacterium]